MIVKQSSINIDDELRLFGSTLRVYYQKSWQIIATFASAKAVLPNTVIYIYILSVISVISVWENYDKSMTIDEKYERLQQYHDAGASTEVQGRCALHRLEDTAR